jgi:uncharacterized protein
VKISYDPTKRETTLQERGFDFEDAGLVFAGPSLTQRDERFDYGEDRYQTYGLLRDRLVMVVWLETDKGRRVISMRKCNDREQAEYGKQLG